jgi:hypothetical protein
LLDRRWSVPGVPIILFTQYAEFAHTSLLGDPPFDRIVSKIKGTELMRHVKELLRRPARYQLSRIKKITITSHTAVAASTVGCKEPVRVNELGSLPSLPFGTTLSQLDNESLAGSFAKICGRRAHIASSFPISKKLCIRHFL